MRIPNSEEAQEPKMKKQLSFNLDEDRFESGEMKKRASKQKSMSSRSKKSQSQKKIPEFIPLRDSQLDDIIM
jgi:hypothetical protein